MDHYYHFCVIITRFFITRVIERALSLPISVFPQRLIIQHTMCFRKLNGINVYKFSQKHLTNSEYLAYAFEPI